MKSSIACGIALLSALLLASHSHANDSAFSGVGGTPKPMRGEHPTIAMQNEKIVIVADAKGYSTDVEFIFRNDGAATSVQMGFPENSFGDVPAAKTSAFLRFASSVDGKVAETRRIITSEGEDSTDAYWIKTVAFGPRQTRRVRVSYRSPWGGNVEWGTRRALNYNFTGQNWKGKVERSDLEIRVTEPGLWLALPLFDDANLPMSQKIAPKLATFRKTWRNWQAQGNFTFGLTRTVPFWMLDRATLSTSITTPAHLENAVTFRVGSVPKELPVGAETPPAFTRNGVNYIALEHLKRRLEGFALDLEKQRKTKPQIALKWNAEARFATLTAGSKTLDFSSRASDNQPRPILLQGQNGPTLYVPVATLINTLGLGFKADPKNRLFDLNRGSWTGK